MTNTRIFSSAVSPKLIVIDPSGTPRAVARIEEIGRAIRLADESYAIGGNSNWSEMFGEGRGGPETEPVVLFYARHDAGRPGQREIAGVAEVIAHCRVRLHESGSVVNGNRSVAHTIRASQKGGACFLASQFVWYNPNRYTAFPGSVQADIETMVTDINQRLTSRGLAGTVSLPRA